MTAIQTDLVGARVQANDYPEGVIRALWVDASGSPCAIVQLTKDHLSMEAGDLIETKVYLLTVLPPAQMNCGPRLVTPLPPVPPVSCGTACAVPLAMPDGVRELCQYDH